MNVFAFAAFCLLGLGAFAGPAAADPIADFYAGHNITIVVSTGPGGGYDLYARTLAQHMQRHVPGKPTIITQYMPGAGGIKAANHVYTVAARDGSVIALPSQAAALVQVLDGRGIRYNAAEFNYIGRMVSTNSVVMVWHDAPAKTLEAMKKTEVVFATDGKGTQSQYNLALMRNLLGEKFKLVQGYNASALILQAMEKGEVHGYAYSWATLRASKRDWLDGGKIVPLAEIGLKNSTGLSVPLVMDLATDPDHKRALELVASPTAVGRSFVAPPKVPAERVAALRKAFDETMKDPALVADAEKRHMEIDPMTGAEVQQVVERTVSTPKALLEKVRKMLD